MSGRDSCGAAARGACGQPAQAQAREPAAGLALPARWLVCNPDNGHGEPVTWSAVIGSSCSGQLPAKNWLGADDKASGKVGRGAGKARSPNHPVEEGWRGGERVG